MYFLITPKTDGPDLLHFVSNTEKQETVILPLPEPIVIEGHTIVAWPIMRADAMTSMRHRDSAMLFAILRRLLDRRSEVEILGGENGDFTTAWKRNCRLTPDAYLGENPPSVQNIQGRVTVLLVDENGRILLFTFDTDQPTEVLSFKEPVLYKTGMILTEELLREQMRQSFEERLTKVAKGFDANDLTAGLYLESE